jgi:ribosome-binding factor A
MVHSSSKRALQVAELIWRNLADILRQYGREPALNSVIISHVHVSNDLSKGTVFFSLLNKATLKPIQALLTQEKKRIRSLLAKKVTLRYMPELKFVYDSFADEKERLLNLLNDLPQ